MAGMHQRGVIHRDITPANIVDPDDGIPCLVYFALASSFAEIRPEFTHQVGRLLAGDFAILVRYDPSETLEVVGAWTSTGAPAPTPVGVRLPLGGRNVITLVWGTGLARIDYDDAISGTIGQVATDWGLRSSVGVPVSVEGRLWGAMVAAFTRPEHLPGDTETRLAGFTELVATAIANAGAQAEVTASRARIVAAADQARLADRAGPARWRPAAAGYAGAAAARGAGRGAARARGAGRGTRPRCRRSDRRAGRAARDRARHPPAILAKGGLRRALKTLARRSPIPVELQVRADERLPDQVEVSAYYVVAEALTNAARHSRASAVSVEVEVAGEVLRVAVRDDGAGGADLARGTGLVGLKDRVQALGGRIFLDSRSGAGTSLQAEFPLTTTNDGVTSR